MKQPTNKISIFNIYISTKLEFYISFFKLYEDFIHNVLFYTKISLSISP